MKKSFFSWLLAIVMILSLMPVVTQPVRAISGDEMAVAGNHTASAKTWNFLNYNTGGTCGEDRNSIVQMSGASLTVGDDGKFASYTPVSYKLTKSGGYTGTYGSWALNKSGNAEPSVKAARDLINGALESLIGRSATLNEFDAVFTAVTSSAMQDNFTGTSITDNQAKAYFYEHVRKALRSSLAQSDVYDPSEPPPPPADPETVPVADKDPEASEIPLGEDGEDGYIQNPGQVKDKTGLKLSKSLSEGVDGTYNLTIGTYSTANTTKLKVNEKVPTDFVVVVDQSGSMSETDMAKSGKYQRVTTSVNLEDTKSGNYYYYDVNDGVYYRVYPVQDYLFEYYKPNYWFTGKIIERLGTNLSWFMSNTEATTNFENQFYFREEKPDGTGIYEPIKISIVGKIGTYYVKFRYVDKNGDVIPFNRENTLYTDGVQSPWYENILGDGTISPGWGLFPVNYTTVNAAVQAVYPNDNAYTYSEALGLTTGMFVNYPMYDRHIGYTKLCYRDVDGVEHTLKSTSGLTETEYCNSSEQAITTKDGTTRMSYANLYRTTETESRLSALKSALTSFAGEIAKEYDTKDNGNRTAVDNRIAIVGFSSDTYNNTEILTGCQLNGTNGVQKDDATVTDYQNALISVNNNNIGVVNADLADAIEAITARGGTQPEDGLEMAKEILANRTEKTYEMTTSSEVKDRNTIVIFFTDGHPGDYEYSDMYTEANEVVDAALDIKQLKNDQGEPLNTTIFSIGVFGDSDANPLTYPREAKDAYTEHYAGDPNDPDDPPKDIYHAAEEYFTGNLVYDADKTKLKENNLYKYEGGFVKTVPTTEPSGYQYYLRRQWRANNADYTPIANDTIYDYMSVVSSNYPSAEYFIHPDWMKGVFTGGTYVEATEGVRHDSVGSNKFYRMASNQATLIAAFREAVTYAGEISSSSSSTSLDSRAVVKDTINISDFDISEAEYAVYKQPIRVNTEAEKVEEYEDADHVRTLVQSARPVPEDGGISYTGFAFDDEYVSIYKSNGNKLVIEITGLRPKEYNVALKSNADPQEDEPPYAAGVYAQGAEEPKLSIQSPTLYLVKGSSTYIADFNAPLVVATDVTEEITQKEVYNGDFTKENTKAVYRLNAEKLSNASAGTILNSHVFDQVDRARITGRHVEDGENARVTTQTVNVIPGSNIYYSDKLGTSEPVTIGDGYGYNAEIEYQEPNKEYGNTTSDSFYFTFSGTGIDVYCTTTSSAGYVQAAVFKGPYTGNSLGERVGSPVIMKNTSAENRYNTPTISFTGLDCGTYTVKITAMKNSHYLLDGIRVYNPTSETILAETDEAETTYLNLRKLLLNEESGFSVSKPDSFDSDFDLSLVTGALYLDDAKNLVTNTLDEEGKEISLFETNFDAYKKDGPKNEIYLDKGQGITFQLNTSKFTKDTKVWVGLSAPVTGSGEVYISGSEGNTAVTSKMDMYYPINMDAESTQTKTVTITNQTESLISVTNLKISGVAGLIEKAMAGTDGINTVAGLRKAKMLLFSPMTSSVIEDAAENGLSPVVVTEEDNDSGSVIEDDDKPTVTPSEEPTENVNDDPAEEPTIQPTETPAVEPSAEPSVEPSATPDDHPSAFSRVVQTISRMVSSLFGSISRLFGR